MAIGGFHYWALVGMTLVSALTNVIAVWIALPWRPGRPQRGCGVRPLIAFGGSIVTTMSRSTRPKLYAIVTTRTPEEQIIAIRK